MWSRLLFGGLFLVAAFTLHGTTATLPLHPRVIGGAAVFDRCKEPYSWMVALRLESSLGPVTYCSGVLLTDQVLVTAGRCMYQYISQGFASGVAVVGERDLQMTDQHEEAVEIESFKIHSGYNDTTLANNIAVVRLARPVAFNQCVLPARRMQHDPDACTDVDTSCTMVGWGPYAENVRATNSRLPRSASVQVYDELVSRILSVQDRGIETSTGNRLAEAAVQGVKACLFDWGGVVSCKRNNFSVLRGLIGDHNCYTTPTPPVTVTDLPTYHIWLDTCLTDWSTCQAL